MAPKTEEQLRSWGTQQLQAPLREVGLTKIPDPIWDFASKKGSVHDALMHYDTDERRDDLLQDLSDALSLWKDFVTAQVGGALVPRKVSIAGPLKRDDSSLKSYESERAVAQAEYLALLASADRGVREFRDKAIRGDLLTPEEADRFIRSPVNRLMFFEEWQDELLKVPFRDIRASLEALEDGWDENGRYKKLSFIIRFPEPARRYEFRQYLNQPVILLDFAAWYRRDLEALLRATSPSESSPRRSSPTLGEIYIDSQGPQGDPQGELIPHLERSWLGRLTRLGERLAKQYNWRGADAMWFVLTGAVPPVFPVRTEIKKSSSSDHSIDEVVLTVQPWVTPDTVLDYYRRTQEQLGYSNRPMTSMRKLALFRFMIGKMQIIPGSGYYDTIIQMPPGEAGKGKNLLGEWNATHTNLKSYKNLANFWQDYYDARDAIARPGQRSETNDRDANGGEPATGRGLFQYPAP